MSNNDVKKDIFLKLNDNSGSHIFPNLRYTTDISLAKQSDAQSNGFIIVDFGFGDPNPGETGVYALIKFIPRIGITTESYDILNMVLETSAIRNKILSTALNTYSRPLLSSNMITESEDEPFDFFAGFDAGSVKRNASNTDSPSPIGILPGKGRFPTSITRANIYNPRDGKYITITAPNLTQLNKLIANEIHKMFPRIQNPEHGKLWGPQYSNIYRTHINKKGNKVTYEYKNNTSSIAYRENSVSIPANTFLSVFEPVKVIPKGVVEDLQSHYAYNRLELSKNKNLRNKRIVLPKRVWKLSTIAEIPVPIVNKELIVTCNYYVTAIYDTSDEGSQDVYLVKPAIKTIQIHAGGNTETASSEFVIWNGPGNVVKKQQDVARTIRELLRTVTPINDATFAAAYSSSNFPLYIIGKASAKRVTSGDYSQINSKSSNIECDKYISANRDLVETMAVKHGIIGRGTPVTSEKVKQFVRSILIANGFKTLYGIDGNILPMRDSHDIPNNTQ